MRKKIGLIGWCGCCLMSTAAVAQKAAVGEVAVTGNSLTRLSVILRETTFRQGDSVSIDRLQGHCERTHSNLMNTALFNYVYVTDSLSADRRTVYFRIGVEERWYIWPVVDLVFEDRNISTWLRHPDWSKFSLGVGVNVENMRGLSEKMHFNVRGGYQRGFSAGYGNIALDGERRHLLGFSTAYNTVYSEAFGTANNRVQYVKTEEEPVRKRHGVSVNYSYRPEIRTQHAVGLHLEHTRIGDTLLALNPHYWGSPAPVRNRLAATYAYTSDWRDAAAYPLHGTLWEVAGNASVDIGGKFCGVAVYPRLDTYWEFAPRWFYAGEARAKMSAAGGESYIFQQALGYAGDYLRGYEDYVVDGQHFAYLKNTLRFLVLPTITVEMAWLSALYKFNKIHFTVYANVFADAGYARNRYAVPDNTFQNTFLYSGGAGIDLVTYYDITLGCHYAVNKSGEGGFYFTLITPFF